LNRNYYNNIFLDLSKKTSKSDIYVNTGINTRETFVEELEIFFEFNKKIDYNILFNADLNFYKNLNLKIIKIKVNQEVTLNEQIEILFEDLENLDSNNLQTSRFYFLIE
jgi:hypothetical protein